MITEHSPLGRRPIQDTPCARCGHGNKHGLGMIDSESCRELMISISLEGMAFFRCNCPEWIDPKLKVCVCGARATRVFLNGARACSAECAAA